MIKNCKFCQKKLVLSDSKNDSYTFFCEFCLASYTWDGTNNKLRSYSIACSYKEKEFLLLIYNQNHTNSPLSHVETTIAKLYSKLPKEKYYHYTEISFDYKFGSITPVNFAQKIPTLLLFS